MLDSLFLLMESGSVIGLFLQVVPISFFVAFLYALYRCWKIKAKAIPISWSVEILRWLFVCYLTGLINLVLVPANLWGYIWFYLRNGYQGGTIDSLFSGEINLIPTLFRVFTGELTLGHWVKTMLIGNILMFVPFGAFLPFITNKVNRKSILRVAVIVPVAVEVIQPVVGRSFDIDDLILNFAGIMLGFIIATGVKNTFSKR